HPGDGQRVPPPGRRQDPQPGAAGPHRPRGSGPRRSQQRRDRQDLLGPPAPGGSVMRILKRHKGPLPIVPGRTEGWETRLVDTLSRYGFSKFEWGKSDCLTHVADVCEAMTGVDPLLPLRGYASEEDAARLLAARGCASVGDALAQAF